MLHLPVQALGPDLVRFQALSLDLLQYYPPALLPEIRSPALGLRAPALTQHKIGVLGCRGSGEMLRAACNRFGEGQIRIFGAS